MGCSYCGLATDRDARWEVTTGMPGDGPTRYACDTHLPAACEHVGDVGDVKVLRHSAGWRNRDVPQVGDVVRAVFGGMTVEAA
ncbi:hypothetical protein ABZY58_11935 [Micromonospora tulbaghiae]|uniref:hypothetical protein n=1 Tax=Micromonospora tulbaghiae TaxID=479978 RepID=UPI0033A68551